MHCMQAFSVYKQSQKPDEETAMLEREIRKANKADKKRGKS